MGRPTRLSVAAILVASCPLAAQTPPGPWPSGRVGHALAYDAARGEVVLIGGDSDLPVQTRDSVWAWSGTGWRTSGAEGPGWRTLPAVAYDALRGRVILQGGRRKSGPRS